MSGPGQEYAYKPRREDDPTRFIPWLRGSSPAFAAMAPSVLEQLFEVAKTINVKRDHVLLAQDQRATHLYVVISGNIAIRVQRNQIARELLGYGAGEVAGLLALVDQRVSPYEIRAVTDAQVVAVDVNRIAMLRAAFHPTGIAVLDAFMPMLKEHLRQLDDRAVRLAARKNAGMRGSGQTISREDR
jgi:CRP-like cAMP-binding protein